MRNLVTALEEAGAALTDVVKTTVYVASSQQSDLVKAWEVYREYMGEHDVPSTLLGVTVLGYSDQLVEVEAVAVLAAPCGVRLTSPRRPADPPRPSWARVGQDGRPSSRP